MNYKTTFKKSRLNVYRIDESSFKCVASCVLKGIDPKDTILVRKLQKKFKDIKITDEGVSFEVVTYSKCHKSDTFSESKGKQLAESRCKKKIFNRAEKIMQCVVKIKEDELMNAQKSLTKYGIMVDTEFDHLMKIEGRKIYRVDYICREDAEDVVTSDVKLIDLEYNPNDKNSVDTSRKCNIKDEIQQRAKVEVGDLVYVDVDNPTVIYQASQLALIKRQTSKN